MPTALTTSKRKFHTLLESLTPHPSSSRSSVVSNTSQQTISTSHDTPSTKRPRLSPRSSLLSTHPLSSSSQLLTLDRAPTPTKDPKPIHTRTATILKAREQERRQKLKDEAQYNPWSSEGFLGRLKTFSDLTTWTPGKPDEINEVVWAKRGWSCDGVNRVACKKGCEARVVVSLRPKRKDAEGKEIEGSEDFSEEVSEELVKRYEALVVEGHHEGCLWRVGRGCAEDIYRIGVVRGEQWQRELRERYWSFQQLEQNMALPDKERMDCPVGTEQTAQKLEDDFFDGGPSIPHPSFEAGDTAPTREQPINHTTLSLALLGWQAPTNNKGSHTTSTASCQHCFRRIGLWMYTAAPSADEEDPMKLDLVNSHRHYCPWINGASQSMPAGTFDGLPAYEVLQRVIAGWAGMRARARKSGARPASRLSMAQPDEKTSAEKATEGNSGEGVESRPSPAKSREEVREDDRKRFARLRELTRIMGLKRRKQVTPAATTA